MLWVLSYLISYIFILVSQTLILWLISLGRSPYEQPWLTKGVFISAFIIVPLIALPVSLVVFTYFKKSSHKKSKTQYKGINSIVIMLTIGLILVGLMFLLLYPSIVQSGLLP